METLALHHGAPSFSMWRKLSIISKGERVGGRREAKQRGPILGLSEASPPPGVPIDSWENRGLEKGQGQGEGTQKSERMREDGSQARRGSMWVSYNLRVME